MTDISQYREDVNLWNWHIRICGYSM